MTTQIEMNEWLKINGYVKKRNNIFKYVMILILGLAFIAVIFYGVENDKFKSNVYINNTIIPETDILNNYSFNPTTQNDYVFNITNNNTINNKINSS